MKELIKIQSELKAPKSQRNSFGNYNYRSCEDILEALKPLLAENDCYLVISDEIMASSVGNLESEYIVINKNPVEIQTSRTYIRATATITNSKGESVSATALARESANKTGMDSAQLTGATSSYARKYALNGLFLIDDTKDADATNDHGKGYQEETTKPPLNKDGIKGADGRKYIAGFESAEQALEQLRKTRTLDSEDRTLVIDIWHAERGDADTEWAGDK